MDSEEQRRRIAAMQQNSEPSVFDQIFGGIGARSSATEAQLRQQQGYAYHQQNIIVDEQHISRKRVESRVVEKKPIKQIEGSK